VQTRDQVVLVINSRHAVPSRHATCRGGTGAAPLDQSDYARGRVSLERVRESVVAWNAHASFGTTGGLRRDVMRAARFVRTGTG
jgi:hypothetical protein